MKCGLLLLLAVVASLAVPETAQAAPTVALGAGSTVVISRLGRVARPMRARRRRAPDAQGRSLGLTAGHCVSVGERILTADRRTVVARW